MTIIDGKQTFIKIKNQEKGYCAINIQENDNWIEFDRVNTRTGETAGHFRVRLDMVETIETR